MTKKELSPITKDKEVDTKTDLIDQNKIILNIHMFNNVIYLIL